MSNIDIRKALCDAPDTQIDGSMFPLIERWDDPPAALQVLEVLDACIHGSLASGFVVGVLQALYRSSLAREGTTHELVVTKATWRTD